MASTTMVRPGEVVVLAISRGDLSRVKDLLDNGASVNERGRHATTALHWAASADEVDIVTTLLAHGGDPNLRAADGCTPLHYAVREDARTAHAPPARSAASAQLLLAYRSSSLMFSRHALYSPSP